MSAFRPGSHGSSSKVSSSKNTSPEKKPSLPARVIRWTAVQIVSFVLAVLILGIGYAAVTWTNIPSGSGAAGQPVTQTLIQGIINNMNDLNSRLTGINPTGTVLSGSSLCLDGVCKGDWSSIGGGGTTGMQGLYYPFRNKTLSCDAYQGTTIKRGSGTVSIDNNGAATSRVWGTVGSSYTCDSGPISGRSATCLGKNSGVKGIVSVTLNGLSVEIQTATSCGDPFSPSICMTTLATCNVNWPET